MAKSPYYKVFTNETNREITNYITRFSYESAVDADSLLSLDLNDDFTYELLNAPDLQEGKLLYFQFGYIGGKKSPRRVCRISNITPNYGKSVTFRIQGTDLGLTMKKTSSKKVWKNLTASEIATQIAEANGLTPVVEETTKKYTFMPQSGKTHYNFLKYLASIEKNGSYRFFLQNDELHFTRLALEKESIRTFAYNDPNGGIITFAPASKEMVKKAASRETVITTVDPFTNEPIQTVINESNSKDDVKLDKYTIFYNADGDEIKRVASKAKSRAGEDSGSLIMSPAGNKEEIDNIANNDKKNGSLDDMRGSLAVEGDPDIDCDEIITINGVAKRDAGNWYISRANHQITGRQFYRTICTLNKNASKANVTGQTSGGAVNNTIGPDGEATKDKNVKLYYYDENGNEVKPPPRPRPRKR